MKKKQWKLHAKKGWSMAVEIAEERDQLREDLKAALDDLDRQAAQHESNMSHRAQNEAYWRDRCEELEARVKELEYVISLLRPGQVVTVPTTGPWPPAGTWIVTN